MPPDENSAPYYKPPIDAQMTNWVLKLLCAWAGLSMNLLASFLPTFGLDKLTMYSAIHWSRA
jgi:hypothetical protein